MRKALAVLATVSAVAATTVTAPPAQARGIGPGLAFGLAAGALTAGAIAASGPYYYGPGYGYYGPRYYGPAYHGGPLRLLWRAVLPAPLLAPSLVTANQKARRVAGLFSLASRRRHHPEGGRASELEGSPHGQNEGC